MNRIYLRSMMSYEKKYKINKLVFKKNIFDCFIELGIAKINIYDQKVTYCIKSYIGFYSR